MRRVGWAIAVSLTVLVTAWWSVERPTDPVARRDRPDRSVAASVVSDSVDRVPLAASPSRWRTSISIASPVAWGLVVHRADLAGYEDWTRLTDRPIPFGWWQPIEAGLAPLTRSLSSAVNILRSIWPSADDAALDSVSDFSSCVATQVS
jgi:hypothetical protein